MVDLDDRVLDFILFRKWELHSDEQDVGIKSFERVFMLSGGVFKFGTGWGNKLMYSVPYTKGVWGGLCTKLESIAFALRT